ncbi:MAG: hypothetical protein GEV28_26480 [Actinophytocola sp.]|nr:hypothetical protein [Actinophytocola sp.]
MSRSPARPAPATAPGEADPNALSIPPRTTGEMVRGFALGASKTVLTGGVGELVEPARPRFAGDSRGGTSHGRGP